MINTDALEKENGVEAREKEKNRNASEHLTLTALGGRRT